MSDPLIPCLKAVDKALQSYRVITANPTSAQSFQSSFPELASTLGTLHELWGESEDGS